MFELNKSQEYHIRRAYGLTPEQYLELFNRQEGRCNVCQKHQDELPKRLAVDHNHKTLEVRGLLCSTCNHRVVGRHTDAELLRRVADHLDNHTGWFVPKNIPKRRRKRGKKK